jgi:hypothetical protein
MDEKEVITEEKALQGLRLKRSPNYRSFFANTINVVSTNLDFRLIISEMTPDENGEIVNEIQASVALSWEHAKALGIIVTNSVRNHEAAFGQLHIAPKGSQGEE